MIKLLGIAELAPAKEKLLTPLPELSEEFVFVGGAGALALHATSFTLGLP